MFNSRFLIIGVLAALMMASCTKSPRSPGREYIPDMGRYVAYEGYFENPGEHLLPDGMNAQKAPVGSISQSDEIYPFPATVDGYNAAGAEYTNEFEFTAEEIAGNGKHLYDIYCSVCHGDKGDGQGHLVQIEKFPPPPSYFRADIMDLPDGKRYHTIMYGKGMMGSHATQLDHRERWLVLGYVKSLQDKHASN